MCKTFKNSLELNQYWCYIKQPSHSVGLGVEVIVPDWWSSQSGLMQLQWPPAAVTLVIYCPLFVRSLNLTGSQFLKKHPSGSAISEVIRDGKTWGLKPILLWQMYKIRFIRNNSKVNKKVRSRQNTNIGLQASIHSGQASFLPDSSWGKNQTVNTSVIGTDFLPASITAFVPLLSPYFLTPHLLFSAQVIS